MTQSSYVDNVILSPNFYVNRYGRMITRITPHHTAGVIGSDACANLFTSKARQSSCNYCIGPDGRVTMSVPEEHGPWTSSSYENDTQAITFEISNDGLADTGWHVSDASLNKFIDMAVDICNRYGIYPLVPGENLTWHRMFSNTSCPGDYLLSKMQWIADTINSRVSGQVSPYQPVEKPKPTPPPPLPSPASTGDFHGGAYVCNVDVLNVRYSPSTEGMPVATYSRGQVVNLDDWYTINQGYVWGRYVAYSGNTRYIAIGKHTGKPESDDYLIKQ